MVHLVRDPRGMIKSMASHQNTWGEAAKNYSQLCNKIQVLFLILSVLTFILHLHNLSESSFKKWHFETQPYPLYDYMNIHMFINLKIVISLQLKVTSVGKHIGVISSNPLYT